MKEKNKNRSRGQSPRISPVDGALAVATVATGANAVAEIVKATDMNQLITPIANASNNVDKQMAKIFYAPHDENPMEVFESIDVQTRDEITKLSEAIDIDAAYELFDGNIANLTNTTVANLIYYWDNPEAAAITRPGEYYTRAVDNLNHLENRVYQAYDQQVRTTILESIPAVVLLLILIVRMVHIHRYSPKAKRTEHTDLTDEVPSLEPLDTSHLEDDQVTPLENLLHSDTGENEKNRS